MSETNFSLLADEGIDDLPRTLRRERDARERAAREEEERKLRATRTHDFGPMAARLTSADYPEPKHADAVPAIVTRLEVPFVRLMLFFIKAVFAAIPALILLGLVLAATGKLMASVSPKLVPIQMLIQFPNLPDKADPAPQARPAKR